MDELLAATQVLIGLVDPIGTRRVEHIQIHCVRRRFCFVRHVLGHGQHFTGARHAHFAINPEL